MADFELVLVQPVQLQFPGADIQGCFFHFSQCLWRKVQALDLIDLYKNDPVTQRFIHNAVALAFVPVAFVRKHG